MDDVHSTHCASGVVEDPLLVQVDMSWRYSIQFIDDILDDTTRISAMLSYSPFRQVMQLVGLEDVEALEVLVDHVEDGCQ